MNAEKITNLTAYDFSGNPGAVITIRNTYTCDQYEPVETAWMRHADNVRGCLKISDNGSKAVFSPAHFA